MIWIIETDHYMINCIVEDHCKWENCGSFNGKITGTQYVKEDGLIFLETWGNGNSNGN